MVGLAATVPLKADDPNTSGIRFGGMVSYTTPSEDLSGGLKMTPRPTISFGLPGTDPGYGATLFAEKAFGHKMAGRARLEYMTFGEKKVVFTSDKYDDGSDEYGHKSSANAIAVMLDYIYRLDSHNKGLFCIAGVGLLSAKTDYTQYIYDSRPGHENKNVNHNLSKTSTLFGISFGIGYNFNQNIGIEAKYTKGIGAKAKTLTVEVNPDESITYGEKTLGLGFDFAQLSISYRF
jgi:opacity protein-like surface antigen